MDLHRFLRRALLAGLALALLIQLVPYGRAHANPAVLGEPAWDSPRTRELARRACFDCHSHETRWPWYSHVAPLSWLVQHDVDEGRAALDVSAWTRPQEEAGEAAESVREGEMPPRPYLWTHAQARLGAAEREELARGLAATFGTGGEGEERGRGGDEDDDDEEARLGRAPGAAR